MMNLTSDAIEQNLPITRLVTDEVKVIEDVALKILWVFKVIVVSVVTDDNIRVLNNVFK